MTRNLVFAATAEVSSASIAVQSALVGVAYICAVVCSTIVVFNLNLSF